MKKFFKLVAVLTALAMAGFGLTSCSDDDDDDNNSVTYNLIKNDVSTSTVAAKYVGTISGTNASGYPGTGTDTVYFYADNKWKEDVSITITDGSNKATLMYTAYSGTYVITSGDWTSGSVSLTRTKKYSPSSDYSTLTEKDTIGSGTLTITNSTFTISGVTFTKQ